MLKARLIKNHLKEGDTFIDVGANAGFYSSIAAAKVGNEGSVIAIEPEFDSMTKLAESLELYTNSIIIQAAAWKSRGFISMYRNTDEETKRMFESRFLAEPDKVPAFPLDDLNLKKVHLINIDQPGTEHVVLIGAKSLIKRFKPRITIGWHPDEIKLYGDDPLLILKFYENLGYYITVLGDTDLPYKDYSCTLVLEPR